MMVTAWGGGEQLAAGMGTLPAPLRYGVPQVPGAGAGWLRAAPINSSGQRWSRDLGKLISLPSSSGAASRERAGRGGWGSSGTRVGGEEDARGGPCPCAASRGAHLEGLPGAGVITVTPLPRPLGLGEVAALQAGPKDVDVEEGVVAAGEPLAPGLQHQLPQRVRRTAHVDNCAGRDRLWHRTPHPGR